MKQRERHQIRQSGSRLLTPVIFSDFDGTITKTDVTDLILEEFGDPAWRDIEEEWLAGRIGSRECLRRQMSLVRAPADEIDALIDSVPLDPHFASFHQSTRDLGIPFYVVSDGFDYVIRRILRRCGVDGELLNGSHLFASAMRVAEGLAVEFPHWPVACAHGCATCKPEVIRRVRGDHAPVIFIGDGLSDCFAVEEADVVFGKDKLLAYCRQKRFGCTAYGTFADIRSELERMGAFPRPAGAFRESQVGLLSR